MRQMLFGVIATFCLLNTAVADERETAPQRDSHCGCARCNEELPFRFTFPSVDVVGLDSINHAAEAAATYETFDFPISKALGVPTPPKDRRPIFSLMIAKTP